jgi:hypothetical protein
MEKIPWYILEIGDGNQFCRVDSTDESHLAALCEYRQNGSMLGWFFAPLPGQENDDAWNWGPAPDEIEWDGFEAALTAVRETNS